MFQFPGFPSYSYVFTARSWPLRSGGFPIRKSAGQSPCPAHRSLSQVVTSFFGSRCQGIRPVLFLAWTLLRNISIPSGSLFWFFILRITWVSQTFSRLHITSVQRLLRVLLTYRHFHDEIVFFYPRPTKKPLFSHWSSLSVRFTLSYSVFNEHNLVSVTSYVTGGLKWTRTTDLVLIRHAL